MHLWKMISTFYKDYPKKLTTILLPLDSALPMAKPIVKLTTKQKYGRLGKDLAKQIGKA